VCVCVCVCVCVDVCVCVIVNLCMCVCVFVLMCMCVCMFVCVHICFIDSTSGIRGKVQIYELRRLDYFHPIRLIVSELPFLKAQTRVCHNYGAWQNGVCSKKVRTRFSSE